MTVVLVDPRRPSLVPVEAVELLTGEVQYTEEMPVAVPWSLPSARPAHTGDDAPVLLSSDANHPAVTARLAAGDRLISAPESQRGERLVDAVAMMDKLRTAGPWESKQTHDSLRRYLLEETYELFDAVRSGIADELREELGDVLLQVLFHARIAEDAPQHAFTIDEVADALVRKLGNRVPGVLAGEDVSLDDQLAQWEERKAIEKSRNSVFDDVPTAQPALALAQKVVQRVERAGLPVELIPESITSVRLTVDGDAETELRSQLLEFMDTVRSAEKAVAAVRRGQDTAEVLDAASLGVITEEEWRACWPQDTDHLLALPEEPAAYSEPSSGSVATVEDVAKQWHTDEVAPGTTDSSNSEALSDETLSNDSQTAGPAEGDPVLSVQDGEEPSEATAEEAGN